jgi:ABC-type polysaccharide/polyol phosphate transport system ATPase subunit
VVDAIGRNGRNDNSLALKVENISKVFDSEAGRFVALRRINFSVNKGELVSIVGWKIDSTKYNRSIRPTVLWKAIC